MRQGSERPHALPGWRLRVLECPPYSISLPRSFAAAKSLLDFPPRSQSPILMTSSPVAPYADPWAVSAVAGPPPARTACTACAAYHSRSALLLVPRQRVQPNRRQYDAEHNPREPHPDGATIRDLVGPASISVGGKEEVCGGRNTVR